jgi:hypothetical protein
MLPDIIDTQKTADDWANEYSTIYPGFPRFVHLVMAHVTLGKTADEAAALVRTPEIMDQVTGLISYLKAAKATRDESGTVVVPDPALDEKYQAEVDARTPPAVVDAVDTVNILEVSDKVSVTDDVPKSEFWEPWDTKTPYV